ncbi:dihydropteroate synthase [Catalinimonas niigatensis]|uniref:dihydropteroate synthase n=1 Tax=Catalinimonas niigatensis TaxID=1397264 RepID=UPI0026670F11|nr:dihydropteroate synthase [Catalinimonas niigatensis]WPP49022.1 dihydropteroate synthase [Catalinimonas niigatensis]
MGVINVTPDSFYDGGRYEKDTTVLLRQAEKILQEGATIIDIGGYSSRPGADPISAEEEKKRTINAIELVSKSFPEAYISVDTFRAEVAWDAVNAGACMINDISGGDLDHHMFDTVASLQVPYVLMHMRGTPQTMKELSKYDDLIGEITDYFQRKLTQLREKGVADVIIDPGFGFAKTIDQNYELLRKLQDFQILDVPVLAGLSRKSMLYKRLKITADEALNGTTVLNTLAILNGASILRVHDVKEAIQTIKILKYTY